MSDLVGSRLLCTKFDVGNVCGSSDRPPSLFLICLPHEYLLFQRDCISRCHTPTPSFKSGCVGSHICQGRPWQVRRTYPHHPRIHQLFASPDRARRTGRTHGHKLLLRLWIAIHAKLLLEGFLSILLSWLSFKNFGPIIHRNQIWLGKALPSRLLVDVAREQWQIKHVQIIGTLSFLIFILVCHFLLSDG